MSPIKRFFITLFFIFILASSGFLLWISNKYVVPIMMYHNVNYADEPKANTVSPENFERHMAFLKEHNYQVLSLDDLVEKIKSGKRISHKSVVVTFDDGYEDNYSYAFDILQKYEIPATIFIPSDLIGTKGYLVWDQVKEMLGQGIHFGSHTRHHTYLPNIPAAGQKEEIEGSKHILEEELGVEINHFAYPIGGFSEQIKGMVREAGYKSACATNRGYDRMNKDVFELNRIRFGDNDGNDFVLWAKLSGYYNTFRKPKSPN